MNRPEHGNAINLALAKELAVALATAADDPAIRCVVLTGVGRTFCAGGDVSDFAEAGDQAGVFLRELADMVHVSVRTLAEMTKPVVVLVNGSAAGAGLSLVLLGDIVIASSTAVFTTAYSSVGLTPDGGMSWSLQRMVGLRRAQEMLITNRRVEAAEAAEIGIVTSVVNPDLLLTGGNELIAKLVAGPTLALGRTRALLRAGAGVTLDEQLQREAEEIAKAGIRSEAREGFAAFVEKRKPDFHGAAGRQKSGS